MALKAAALLSTFMLMYLLVPLVFTSADSQGPYQISLVVYNSLTQQKNRTFTTQIAYRGILIGAMKKIEASTNKFRFTVIENADYGPFLVSVNGVAGNATEHTYWQLLVKPKGGAIFVPDVGIGCYIPKPNDKIILKFTTW